MKSSILAKISIFLAIFAFLPVTIFAAEIRGNSEVYIDADSTIEENLYIGAGQSRIEGKIKKDASIVSGETFITNDVDGDLVILSGRVTVSGNIKGDVKIVGGDVTINGNVEGELVVIGGSIFINENVTVGGDTILVGGKVTLLNTSNNGVHLTAGKVSLNGTMNGYTEVTTQDLSVGENANINGRLNYFSPKRISSDSESQLHGQVNYNQISSIQDNGILKQAVLSFINFWILLRFVTTLLLAFLLVYVFKVFSQKTTEYALNSFGKSFIIGILTLILLPLVVIILFVSLIALPISFLLMIGFLFILIISGAISGIVLGALIKKVFKKGKDGDGFEISFQTATLGVILLAIVQFVPYIGELSRFVFYVVSVGAVAHSVYMNIRWRGVNK